MIGQLTELSLNATFLALTYEQLAWPQGQDEFTRLRAEANRLLASMDIAAEVPATQEQYLAERPSLNGEILQRLAEDRQRILGDTVALPLFFLHSMAYRVAATAPFGIDWQQEREIIQQCMEDLGLSPDLITHLDREVGWVFAREDAGEATIGHVDIIRAGGSFLQRVLEEFARIEDSVGGNQAVIQLLGEVRQDVQDFRDEYRKDAQRLAELLEERNAEVVTAVQQIQERLLVEGVSQPEAAALTDEDPAGLWNRLMRWAAGAPWKDAAEEALWAALDFVPGGTGVKLGIKVTRAVRKSLKRR